MRCLWILLYKLNVVIASGVKYVYSASGLWPSFRSIQFGMWMSSFVLLHTEFTPGKIRQVVQHIYFILIFFGFVAKRRKKNDLYRKLSSRVVLLYVKSLTCEDKWKEFYLFIWVFIFFGFIYCKTQTRRFSCDLQRNYDPLVSGFARVT